MGCANAKAVAKDVHDVETPPASSRRQPATDPVAASVEPGSPPQPVLNEEPFDDNSNHEVGDESSPSVVPNTLPKMGVAGDRRTLALSMASAAQPTLALNGKGSAAALCKAAADFLATRLGSQSWVENHKDVAFYCKAPLVFVQTDRHQEANTALDCAAAYVEQGGAGSAFSTYANGCLQAPWLWMLWAAGQLGRKDVAGKCYEKIRQYRHPLTDSGLVKAPYKRGVDFEADFFATAVLCKAALLQGDDDQALDSGDSLLRAIEANDHNMKQKRFCLRWTWDDGLIEELSPFHCVQQDAPGQMYSMLGFPAAVLFELAASGSDRATYRRGGIRLLNFLKSCQHVAANPSSAVVAYAVRLSQDTQFEKMAKDIVDVAARSSNLKTPSSEDVDAMHGMTEAAFWLAQTQAENTGEKVAHNMMSL